MLRPIPTCCVAIVVLAALDSRSAQSLLAVEWDTGRFFQVSTTNASLTPLGTAVANMAEIEFAPDGNLYGFTAGGSPNLYRLDPSNGRPTLLGALNGGFIFEGGLAFAPDGTTYGTNQQDADHPTLFRLNIAAATVQSIGQISGGAHDINALAWRSDGRLVGLDRVTNALLLIDPATAASSTLRAVSASVGSLGGMATSGDRGYFCTAGPSGGGSNELWSVDLTTGQHTRIGGFGSASSGSGISGLALATACTPPTIGVQPQSAIICAGATVTLNVAASGSLPAFQWRHGGVGIPGATTSSLTLAAAQVTDSATYDVEVSNGCGSIISDAATVVVWPLGTGDVSGDGLSDGSDIGPFIAVLLGEPGGPPSLAFCAADTITDGRLNFEDATKLITMLLSR